MNTDTNDSKSTAEEDEASLAKIMAEAAIKFKQIGTEPKPDLFEHITPPKLSPSELKYGEDIARRASIQASMKAEDATDISNCTTPEQVGDVIGKYVRFIMETDKRATRLFELNKRFGFPLKRMGSSCRLACQHLVRSGELLYKIHKGVAVYIDPVFLSYELKDRSPEEREDMKNSYIEKAFYHKHGR